MNSKERAAWEASQKEWQAEQDREDNAAEFALIALEAAMDNEAGIW